MTRVLRLALAQMGKFTGPVKKAGANYTFEVMAEYTQVNGRVHPGEWWVARGLLTYRSQEISNNC